MTFSCSLVNSFAPINVPDDHIYKPYYKKNNSPCDSILVLPLGLVIKSVIAIRTIGTVDSYHVIAAFIIPIFPRIIASAESRTIRIAYVIWNIALWREKDQNANHEEDHRKYIEKVSTFTWPMHLFLITFWLEKCLILSLW